MDFVSEKNKKEGSAHGICHRCLARFWPKCAGQSPKVLVIPKGAMAPEVLS